MENLNSTNNYNSPFSVGNFEITNSPLSLDNLQSNYSKSSFRKEIYSTPILDTQIPVSNDTSFVVVTPSQYLTNNILPSAQIALQQFFQSPDLQSKMNLAFGDSWNFGVGQELINNLAHGVGIPDIRIMTTSELNAKGAFGANTIYLSQNLLNPNQGNSNEAVNVLLSEMGHYIDDKLNIQDSPGDEGEIFAKLVQNQSFQPGELAALKAEDDSGILNINGQSITVEHADLEPGVFIVDNTDKISINFLADSGSYRSEMAVFSLQGMEGLTPGSTDFIKEVARRALTNSTLGYVVIVDPNEGAKFTGELGESNQNEGNYSGIKNFSFNAGDKVAMMLVPQGTVKEVFYNPNIEGDKRPLFSIAAANPNNAKQMGQLVAGTFGWEDIRVDQGTDADYNDIVFQIKGATGSATPLAELIAPAKEWRNTPLAQEIITFASQVDADKISPSLTAALSQDTGISSSDSITNNPQIVGSLTDKSGIGKFQARFSGGTNFVDILSELKPDGSFSLDKNKLSQIQGGQLSDGNYQLNFLAEDKFANVSQLLFNFTLDTTKLATPSDIGIKNDSDTVTNQKAPTITGKGENGTLVELFDGQTKLGQVTVVNGVWEITPTTEFTSGVKNLTVIATDIAGNQSDAATKEFTIDTVAPQLNVTGPQANAQLTAGARLQGTVNGTGSKVDKLSYRFNSGNEINIPVNDKGEFDVELNLSGSQLGEQNLAITAQDLAGNTQVTTIPVVVKETISPTIAASLINDTGISASDRITSDSTIKGTVTDNSQIVNFQAKLNSGNFVDVLSKLNADGSFNLDKATLAQINGGQLPDSSYQLSLKAEDKFGNTNGEFKLDFTLDTTAPQTPGSMLDSLFDSAPIGDSFTTFENVNILGQTEANATVTLQGTGTSITANTAGKFKFSNLSLALGDNSFTVNAKDTAGNTSTFTTIIKRVAQSNSNVVLDWNATLLNAIYEENTAPPLASRNMAMVQTAVFDAVNSFSKTYKNYHFNGTTPTNASVEAAVASAAYNVLLNLYPNQKTFFDTALTASLSKIPDGVAEDAGVAFGKTVADDILSLRSTDGASTTVNYTPGTKPGDWQPTAPGFASALLPQWGQVTPFALTSGGQFRPTGQPALTSEQYTAEFNQVKDLGSINSTNRTVEQTEIAQFWADGTGTFTPPGHWNQIAQNVAATKGNSLVDNARLFALLNISLADAGIAAWDTKYTYNTWRPITAIQKADTDGNPNTTADANWTPLLTTPPFPEYISGHSTFSGAAATVLTELLGNNTSFTTNSLGTPGVYRNFTNFNTAASEAGISRIYGGIHFNAANVDGLATGKAVGNYVLQNLLASVSDTTPPTVTISSTPSTANSYIELTFNEAVKDTSFAADKYSLKISGGTNDGQAVAISSVQKLSPTLVRLNLATAFASGSYKLSVASGITDLVGNATTTAETFDINIATAPVTISPRNSEEMVALNRDAVVNFGKKVDPATVTSDNFYLIANGKKVEGTIKVSSTEEFATFFYDNPLPSSTEVRVVVDGSKIIGRDGVAIDGDGDGKVGGIATADFTTLPITRIKGTDVWGYVYDSYNKNPDGSNIPIKGVTIRLDSLPDVKAVTDDKGYFILKDVPAPEFFVYIDGSTAAGAPAASQYASLGKPFHSVPGQSTQLFMDGKPFDVYLPPMAASDVKQLSTTEDTKVGFGDTAQAFLQKQFPTVDPELWKEVKVTFNPGSAQDDDGNKATQATIIPVDPNRLPAPLPPGIDPKLVISIQAGGANGFNREAQGGATNFDVPAPIQFPNLDGLKPGEKSLFWSFDHDAGEWVVIGTGTVSEDGKTIVSDPGVGVLAPGWHFVQPGSCGGSGGAPPTPPKPVPTEKVTNHDPEVIGFVTGETTQNFEKSWTAPAQNPNTPPLPPIPGCGVPQHNPDTNQQPFTNVTIEVDGPLKDFMKPVTGGESLDGSAFTLSAGTGITKKFGFTTKTYDEIFGAGGFKNLTRDQLYGSKIKITVVDQKSNGDRTRDIYTYYLNRWVDVIDAEQAKNKTGNTAAFHRTLADGSGGFVREKNVDVHLPTSVNTKFDGPLLGSPFDLGGAISGNKTVTWKFDPYLSGNRSDNFDVQVDDPKKSGLKIGTILAKGTATNATKIDINLSGYKNELKRVLQLLTRLPGADSQPMTADDVFQYTYPGGTSKTASAQFKTQFAGFLPGDTFTSSQLNTKLDAEANALLAAVQADYSPVNTGTGATGYEVGSFLFSDVSMVWEDSFLDTLNNINTTGSGNAIYGYADFDRDTTFHLNNIAKTVNISDAAKQWALAEGLNKSVSNKGSFAVAINMDWSSAATFAQFVANTVSHEIGHTFGLLDAYSSGGNTPPHDIMRAGDNADPDLTFAAQNVNLLRAGLGIHVNGDLPLISELQLYQNSFNQPGSTTGIRELVLPDSQKLPALTVLYNGNDLLPNERVTSATTAVDGIGGSLKIIELVMKNSGLAPLQINSVNLTDKTKGFSILNPDILNNSLAIGESATLKVQFDPTIVGNLQDTLTIATNAGSTSLFQVKLSGQGITATPSANLQLLKNNNLGGVKVDGGSAQATQIAKITNDGAELLTIFGMRIVEGADSFTLLDVPADLATNPIKLKLGESFTFGNFKFDPNKVGLTRGVIEVTTNDPKNPIQKFSVVGTGVDKVIYPDWGNDFITIEMPNLSSNAIQRIKSDKNGNFQTVLPPNQDYHMVVFDPVTSLVTHSYGYTPPSGRGINLTASLVFNASTAADTDGDGLPDDMEFGIGTAANKVDTDGDGIPDFIEISQGLDPLGGQGFPTGVISSLPLQGEAKAVTVAGSTSNSQTQTAYVATGSYGLAVVNASQFNNPSILGQLNLPGDATDVAVDTKLNIAAVATNSGGLQLVNVADGMLPTLNQTINLSANQVEIADGIAYATVGTALKAIDLLSGQELQSLTLPGSGTVTGLAREGTKLYAYVSGSDTFSVVDITVEGAATVLGQLNVNVASSDVGLSVGNGVAYLAGSGLRTIDISNPNSPKLISDADNFFTARGVTLNGSGLALVSAENQGLAIYNSSDPTKTDTFLTVIDTPGFAYNTAVASGIAFIADGTSGLQVINYLPFDNKGQAPTVTINASSIDLDPNTPGIQVQEGSTIPIRADISDDVQVRNVELLVNGEVVTNDVSFPWDLSVIVPAITPDKNTVDIQVRATDTGGNITLSNLLTLNLSPDKFAPTVLGTTPIEGEKYKTIPSISVKFNEAIDTTKLNLSGITLTNLGKDGVLGGGDDVVTTVSALQTRNFDRTLVILPNGEMALGNYQLKIDPSIITDRVGNALANPITLNFTKRPLTTPLTFGTAIKGSLLQAGDDEVYTFTGTPGQRILFDKQDNNTSNIYAEITSPSGISLSNYYYYYYNDSQPLTLTETGTYRVTLKSLNNTTGDYNFKLIDASAAPTITLGTTVTDTLTPGLETDIYQINGTTGQRLFFDSSTNISGAYWRLYGPGNQSVTGNYLGDFETTLTSDGTYLLVLDGYNSNENVNYSFKVTNPPTTTTALTLGNTVTSTISQPGEIKEYTFTGTLGQRLYYDGLINNNTSTIYAQLISPSGQTVFYNGDADSDRQTVTLSESGTYRLIVDGNGDKTGEYSFRLIDAGAAPTITLGTTVTDTLTPGLETDIYRINGTAGQRLFFDSSTNVSSAYWTLYGPGNQSITGNYLRDFETTLTSDGTYLLVLDGYNSNENVNYSFKVTTPAVTTTALTLGNTVTSTISQPGEIKEYTFTGTVGQRLYYDGLINNNTSTIYAKLISPSGQTVFNNDDADDDRTPLTLTETGTYKLVIDGYFNDTGDYSFRLIDASAASNLVLNSTITGTLDPGLKTEIYRINGTAGQKLNFDSSVTASTNGYWYLYNTTNQSIDGGNLSRDFTATLPSDGTYLLVLNGYGQNGTVNYNFKVTDISDTPVTKSGFNSVKTGTIAAGGQDTYNFTAPAGLLVYFDGQSFNANNIIVDVRDANNQSVTSFYSNSDTQPIRLNKSGTYTITVKGANASSTGNYSFQAIDIQAAATDLSLNTPVTKTLTNGAETIVYRFNGTLGQKLYYDALQTDPDAVSIQLISPSGISIFNYNSDNDSSLFTLTETGTYYLLLKGNNSSEADYNFKLMDAGAAPTITLGTTVTDTLTPGLETDIYQINGTAGQRLFFDSSTNISGAYWRLYGPGNQSVTGNYLGDFETTLTSDGTYLLVLDGYNSNENVNYSFKVTNPPTTTTALTLGNTVTSTISQPGEIKEYTFTGTAGQRLYYDGLINNNTSTIYAQLISPSGQIVLSNNDADSDKTPVTLTETGTYKLIIDGYLDNTGDYSFRLIDASVATTITLGTTVTDTLTPGLETDIYQINGTAGQRLFFDFLTNVSGAYWTLYGPGNQYITNNYLGGDFETTLTSDGTYLLVLDGYNSTENVNYSFKVTNPPVTTTALTLGNTVTSTISQPGEIKEYTFTGTAGQRLHYDGLINNNTSTIYAQLISPSGQTVLSNTDADSDRTPVTITESGTYKLIIDGYFDNTGDYSFRLIDTSAAPTITLDTIITNTLNPGLEADVYRINGKAGQKLRFDSLITGFVNSNWTLYSPGNQYVDGAALSSDFEATLPSDGTYLLVINGYTNNDTVNYKFQVMEV